ncbi:TPA: phage tail protein, partial [Escherichia coli]|nr:phage tail protein [Escherichia coli]
VAVLPDNASDPSLRVSTVHRAVATATLKENTVTVNALEKGTTSVVVMSDNGNFVALATVTVNVPAA